MNNQNFNYRSGLSKSSSVFKDISQASEESLSKPNLLALSAMNPFKFATKIPDNRAELTITKSLTVSQNVKPVNGEELYVINWATRDIANIRRYVADPTTKLYSYLGSISADQSITDNYDRARPTTGGIQVYSATTSGGQFNVSGSINATTVQRLPQLINMKHENIVSYKTGSGNVLANVPIEKGCCCLGTIQQYSDFVPFKTTNVYPIDSIVHLRSGLSYFNPLYIDVQKVATIGDMLVETTSLPENTWGRIKIKFSMNITSLVAGTDYFDIRLYTYKADPITGARTTKTYSEIKAHAQLQMEETMEFSAEFEVEEDVYKIGVYYAGTTAAGQALKIRSAYPPYMDTELIDLYQNYSRGTSTLIGITNVSTSNAISVAAMFNYECIMKAELSKDMGEVSTTADETSDLEVMKIIYKKGKFNLNFVLTEYIAWTRSTEWEQMMTRENLISRADVWSDFLKPMLKYGSKIGGPLIGSYFGNPMLGREVGNFISDRVLAKTRKNSYAQCSTKTRKRKVEKDCLLKTEEDLNHFVKKIFGTIVEKEMIDIYNAKEGENRQVYPVIRYQIDKDWKTLFQEAQLFFKSRHEDINKEGYILNVRECDCKEKHAELFIRNGKVMKIVPILKADRTRGFAVCSTKQKKKKEVLLDEEFNEPEPKNYGRKWKGVMTPNQDGSYTFEFKYTDCKEMVEYTKDGKTNCSTKKKKAPPSEFDDMDDVSFNDGDDEETNAHAMIKREKERVEEEEEFAPEEVVKAPEKIVEEEKKVERKPEISTHATKWYIWQQFKKASFEAKAYEMIETYPNFDENNDPQKSNKMVYCLGGVPQLYYESKTYPRYNLVKVVEIKNNQASENVVYLTHAPMQQMMSKGNTFVTVHPKYKEFTYSDGRLLYIDGSFKNELCEQVCRVYDACPINYGKKPVFITTKFYEKGVEGGSWGGAFYALINQFPYGPTISANLKRLSDYVNDGFLLGGVTNCALKINEIIKAKRNEILICPDENENLDNYAKVDSGYISSLGLRSKETNFPRVYVISETTQIALLCFMLAFRKSNNELVYKDYTDRFTTGLSNLNELIKSKWKDQINKTLKIPGFTSLEDALKEMNVIDAQKDVKAKIMPKYIASVINAAGSYVGQWTMQEGMAKQGIKKKPKKPKEEKGKVWVKSLDRQTGKETGNKELITSDEQIRRAKEHKTRRAGEFVGWDPIPRGLSSKQYSAKRKQVQREQAPKEEIEFQIE